MDARLHIARLRLIAANRRLVLSELRLVKRYNFRTYILNGLLEDDGDFCSHEKILSMAKRIEVLTQCDDNGHVSMLLYESQLTFCLRAFFRLYISPLAYEVDDLDAMELCFVIAMHGAPITRRYFEEQVSEMDGHIIDRFHMVNCILEFQGQDHMMTAILEALGVSQDKDEMDIDWVQTHIADFCYSNQHSTEVVLALAPYINRQKRIRVDFVFKSEGQL